MKCLAIEVAAREITVKNVAPGTISTEMNRDLLDDPRALADHEQTIPLGRAGTVEHVAGVVVFLTSDAARYIRGRRLPSTAGWCSPSIPGVAADPG